MAVRLREVLGLLRKSYGERVWRRWGSGLAVLVEAILSQNTSDANSSAAFRRLRRRFRTWKAVAAAPVAEVEEAIRVSGLSRIKAPRIGAILRQIAAGKTQGPASRDLSLEFLREWEPQAAMDFLTGFKGVGPKTAACVLLFSFNMPVFPVDTHIHRIARRLRLVPAKSSAEQAQRLLTPAIDSADRYAMHVLLIAHGRQTCRAISPKCEWCGLRGTAKCRLQK